MDLAREAGEGGATPGPQLPRHWKPPAWATALLALALIAGAVWIIYSELRAHSVAEIWRSITELPSDAVWLAALFVAISFAALVIDEWLSLHLMDATKSFSAVLAPAFATYSIANGLSFSFATAPAVRTRLYRSALNQIEIAVLSGITGASVFVGAACTVAIGFLFSAEDLEAHFVAPPLLWRAAGVLLLIPALLWLGVTFGPKGRRAIFGIHFVSPSVRRGVIQLVFSVGEWLAAAAVLYVLLPDHGGWTFPAFAAAFVAACYLGAASGAPAGIGVFDAAILSVSQTDQGAAATAAALIAYRFVYTIAPMVLGALVLGIDFLRHHPPAKH
ncbi:MAG TPA: YbhN family protein [Caulobacterales bacterium]|nr:YbhN family protein [Caulobacterales bacterium]